MSVGLEAMSLNFDVGVRVGSVEGEVTLALVKDKLERAGDSLDAWVSWELMPVLTNRRDLQDEIVAAVSKKSGGSKSA